MDTYQKVTKKEPRGAENRKKRAASNSRLARAATLSLKVNKSPPICKKDLLTFKQTFFNTKPLPFSRLNSLHKLLACQFTLHNQADNMQPAPFVFRLPTNLHGTDSVELNKKLYRKLKSSLGRKPLFWTTREYDRGLDKTITHINGEILLHPGELEVVRKAFKDINGSPKAIRFPLSTRNKLILMYGEFYAIYNWPGYATKQDWQRDIYERKRRLLNQQITNDTQKYHYISQDLSKISSNFYSKHIHNQRLV